MQSRSTQFVRLIGCLTIALAAISAQARDTPEVVVFGDSLSDPGNHFIAFGESARRPFEPVPSASYAIGGHHFSNGRTWIEQLALENRRRARIGPGPLCQQLRRRSSPGPGRRAGLSRLRPHRAGRTHARRLGWCPAARSTLCPLDRGQRRARRAGRHASSGGSPASQLAAQEILAAAVQSIADNIVALYAGGARKFLVGNVPDPAATPVVRELGPAAQGVATYLSGAFNAALAQALQSLRRHCPAAGSSSSTPTPCCRKSSPIPPAAV